MTKWLGIVAAGVVVLVVSGCAVDAPEDEGGVRTDTKATWVRENLDPAKAPLVCIGNPDGTDEVCVVPEEDPLGSAIEALRDQRSSVEGGAEGLACAIRPDRAPVCDEDGDGYVTVGT